MKRWLPIFFALCGLGLFAFFAWEAGPAAIWASLRGLGWYALLIPLPQAVAYFFDTLGWRSAFGAKSARPSLWRLYWIRMAGEAVNVLTPSAYVGGEPLKAHLVRKGGAVSGTSAAASVVVAKTLMTVAELGFLVIGTICAFGTIEAGNNLFVGLAVTIVAGTGIVALLVWVQTRGMFTGTLKLLRRLKIRVKSLESREEKLASLDRELDRFYREEPRAFWASIAWHLVGWIAGAGEVYFGARWLGAPMSVPDALAIEAFAAVLKGVTLFVPGSIGFQETGFVFLFRAFGLPSGAAVGFGLLRRARELFYAGLGFLWFLAVEARNRAAGEDSLPTLEKANA